MCCKEKVLGNYATLEMYCLLELVARLWDGKTPAFQSMIPDSDGKHEANSKILYTVLAEMKNTTKLSVGERIIQKPVKGWANKYLATDNPLVHTIVSPQCPLSISRQFLDEWKVKDEPVCIGSTQLNFLKNHTRELKDGENTSEFARYYRNYLQAAKVYYLQDEERLDEIQQFALQLIKRCSLQVALAAASPQQVQRPAGNPMFFSHSAVWLARQGLSPSSSSAHAGKKGRRSGQVAAAVHRRNQEAVDTLTSMNAAAAAVLFIETLWYGSTSRGFAKTKENQEVLRRDVRKKDLYAIASMGVINCMKTKNTMWNKSADLTE